MIEELHQEMGHNPANRNEGGGNEQEVPPGPQIEGVEGQWCR